MDSTGATVDFYLSVNRDAACGKAFPCQALAAANHPHPRVITVDGNLVLSKGGRGAEEGAQTGTPLPLSQPAHT